MPLPRISASMLAADVRWPAKRPRLVDARFERMDRSAQRVDRQRRGDVGGARQLFGRGQRQREHRRRRLRAVDQRQPFLGAERDRLQPGARAAPRPPGRTRTREPELRARDGPRLVVSSALRPRRPARARGGRAARDRRSRRPSRATGTRGWTPAFSSAISASSVSSADAGEPFRQHVGAQRHRRAHGADRQRLADAGGVAAQQVQLQRLERVGRDLHVGERSESGVDAVGRLVAARACDRPRRATRARARAAAGIERRPARRASAIASSCSSVSDEPSRRII